MDGGSLLKLIQYSEKKAETLENIKEVTVKQGEAIKGKNLGLLNDLIEAKQRLIDEINHYDEEFMDGLSSFKKAAGIKDLSELDRAKGDLFQQSRLLSIIQLIKEYIGQIKDIEENNYALLKKSMDETRDGLNKVGKSKKALKGYYNMTGSETGNFIDKKK